MQQTKTRRFIIATHGHFAAGVKSSLNIRLISKAIAISDEDILFIQQMLQKGLNWK